MKTGGVLFFSLVFLFIGVSSVSSTNYYADETFMSGAECDSDGYTKIFSLNGTDGKEYYYCLKGVPYSSSEEFLVDSYIAFGVELCLTGYEVKEIPFEVYKTAADRTANKTSTFSLCRKRQSRSSEADLKLVGYKPFSTTVCSGVRDSFVDKNGKVIYHCQHWNPGVVSADSGECEDTDGRDVKTADEIELQYGVVLDGDAYGFDLPIQGLTFPEGEMPVVLEQGKNSVNVYKDYCVSRYKLHEYYCDVATKKAKGFEIDCPNGGECSNGKCLNSGIGRPDQESISGCYDADSGANNFSVQSYIDFFSDTGVGFRYYDVCADDKGSLFEYFCKNSESSLDLKSKYMGELSAACACSGGACTGDVTSGQTCADSGDCLTGESCRENNDCRPGLFCFDGICSEEYDAEKICSDTDSDYGLGEDSVYTVGSATKGEIEITDRCGPGDCLYEATCSGSERTEPHEQILKYEFIRCTEGDCKDDGEGGYCGEPEPRCQRLKFNFNRGEDGSDICKDKYGDDAWCDGSVNIDGFLRKKITCSDDAAKDLRADVTCCWIPQYDEEEDERELEEGDAVQSSGLFGSGEFSELMDLLPLLIPLIMGLGCG